jgi:IS5 family transposase
LWRRGSGRSPVDRGKQGTKRSVVTDGAGLPLHLVAAGANDHDSPLLEPTLAGVPDAVGPLPARACAHLDAGYDSGKTRDLLHILGYEHQIATKGRPSPI